MHYVVTGGAGFIGSHYVRSLLRGTLTSSVVTSVVVLDKLTYAGVRANLDPVADDPRLSFVHGDILDASLVDRLVCDADVVVHFAAESHVDRSIAGAADFVMANVVGTQTLLDAALRHGLGRFVHISTDEVYGSIGRGLLAGDPHRSAQTPHTQRSKAVLGPDGAVVSPHLRPAGRGDPLLEQLRAVPVPREGHPAVRRRTCWTESTCRCTATASTCATGSTWTTTAAASSCVARAVAAPGEVYNIGGGTELTQSRADRSCFSTRCGADWSSVEHVTDRKGHDLRYSVDISKIGDRSGLCPSHRLHDGTGRHGGLVPRQPRVVGAAESTRGSGC